MSASFNVNDQWVIAALFIIIIILCTLGNGLVLFVIVTKRHLQTVTNCFIGSLSASDLLVGWVVVSLAMVQTVNKRVITGAACQIPMYFQSVCCTASIYSLLAITFDRYKAVFWSTMKTFTVQKSLLVIVVVWAWSFLYSSKIFILFATNNHTSNADDNDDFCDFLLEEEDNDFWLRVMDAIVLFLIPSAIMMVLYVKMSKRLWFSKMAVNNSVRRKRNIVKFLIFNVSLFLISWAPFYIVELILDGLRFTTLSEEDEEEIEESRWYVMLRVVLIMLALSNSFLNPIVYAFFNPNLREEIHLIFKRPRSTVAPSVTRVELNSYQNPLGLGLSERTLPSIP